MSFQYIINKMDEIVFVNEDWDEFAKENGAHDLVGEKIIWQSIWNFISDNASVYIYREILKKRRAGQDFRFNFRCDSPDCRRFMDMSIILQETGNVLFENRILREETRAVQKILDHGIHRSDEMLIMCSWCNRLQTGSDSWQEIELTVESLGLFEENLPPVVSHGVCPECYRELSGALDAY